MNIIFTVHSSRYYKVRNKETGLIETVTVSNRNRLPVKEHLELLNQSSGSPYEYLEYLGDVVEE